MHDEPYSNVFHPQKHSLRQHTSYSFDSSANVPSNQIMQLIHFHDTHIQYLFSLIFEKRQQNQALRDSRNKTYS